MMYEISRHVDDKTMFNMCLADKNFWESQKESLYKRDYDKFISIMKKEMSMYEYLNKRKLSSKHSNIKKLHKICRILLKYKHVVRNTGKVLTDTIKERFDNWGENGMCKKKIKMYKKSLDLF